MIPLDFDRDVSQNGQEEEIQISEYIETGPLADGMLDKRSS